MYYKLITMKKYTFNKNNLSFEVTKTPFYKQLITFSLRVIPGIILGCLIFFLVFNKIVFPSEQELIEKRTIKMEKYEKLNKKINIISKQIVTISKNDKDLYRPFLQTKELPGEIRAANFGGVDRYRYIRGYENSEIMINSTQNLDIVISHLLIESQSLDELVDIIIEKRERQAHFPNFRPVKKDCINAICTFGMRMQPFLKIYRMHKGVDLCAPENTEIYAAADGVVITKKFHFSLGHYLRINHGNGYITVYGHLNKPLVKVGQKVKKGDLIALMGTTGLSEVNHLHYEIYKNGHEVNPMLYFYDDLTQIEYESLINDAGEAVGFIMR